jgi:hypothetical protein
MKKVILSLVTVSTLLLVSCGGSDSPEKDSSLVLSDSAAKVISNSNDTIKPVIVNAPGGTTPALVNSSPATSTPLPAPTVAAKGMNPAHGQPGHRCDISVGAPLNSAPATTTSPAIQTTKAPALQTTPASTTPAVLSNPNAKVNPAHGQPGHDCAVAVGAPLKN